MSNLAVGLAPPVEERLDYFQHVPGGSYAGLHLLVEIWGARDLDDAELISQTLRQAAVDAEATVLYSYFHTFTPNGGVTGVVVLSESHLSIHTWPERRYAAIDVFMCGKADPHRALQRIWDVFQPSDGFVGEYKRGWKPALVR